MTAHTKRCGVPTSGKQHGVVLLLTLIILVAMMLAGIAMMRSVDTGNVIAGNLAFKQATTHAADGGTSTGFTALMDVGNSSNVTNKLALNFNTGSACPPGVNAALLVNGATLCPGGNINLPGYSSTPLLPCEVNRTCTQAQVTAGAYTWWNNAANWNNAPSINVLDPAGNNIATVNYLIHRMCQLPGADPSALGQLCQTYTRPETNCSKTQVMPCNSVSVFYRITTRSVGTRNTLTYTQTLVLITE